MTARVLRFRYPLLAALVGVLVVAVALAVSSVRGSATGDCGRGTAEELLSCAAEAMADERFSSRIDDCPLCPPPVVAEYEPGAVMLSGARGHDDWPYYLLLGREGYVSQTGARWRVPEDQSEFVRLLLDDPRFLLGRVKHAVVERREVVDGEDAAVVAGELDVRRFVEDLSPDIVASEFAPDLRKALDGTTLRFWIAADDYRVLQMQLAIPGLAEPGQDPRGPLHRFDYGVDVDIPNSVESMPAEDVLEIGQDVERAGETLLGILAEYRTRHGVYPPSLDEVTVADQLRSESWPTNPFSGRPMRESGTTPGDFTYLVKDGGQHFELSISGWDGVQMYVDRTRFGHPR